MRIKRWTNGIDFGAGANDGTSRPVVPPWQNREPPFRPPGLTPGGGFKPPDGGVTPPTLDEPFTDPLHLTANATINSTTQGGVNTEALRNPTGAPMEILEIKWQVRSLPPLITNGLASGGVLGCRLMLGNVRITNGFVPIWLFGREENYLVDTTEFVPVGIAATASNPIEFSWKLPRPLFVPSGAVLEPTFAHRGITQGPVDVQVSYSARQLAMNAQPPPVICVPWAASYVSQPFQIAVAGTTQSRETDLVNPFDVPVHLQRFTGRFAVTSQLTRGATTYLLYSDFVDWGACVDMAFTMSDSAGNFVIRTPTLFRQAFGGVTRSWEMHSIMPPRSFYNVLVQHTARAGAANFQVTRQAHVGLTGWREVTGGEL